LSKLENSNKRHAMSKNKELPAFAPEGIFDDPLTALLRNGARQLLQQAVEAELQIVLSQYANVADLAGRRAIVRNGHHPEREVLTPIGAVPVKIPKIRDRSGQGIKFHSSLVPPYVRRGKSIDAAISWLYLKGISTGGMQGALAALVGENARNLSPGVVSRLKAQWADECRDWQRRSLLEEQYVYIWADGIYSALRAEDERLCLLVIIGVTPSGDKKLLAVSDGFRESRESWAMVLRDLRDRGLKAGPKLAVGDGALGFWAAMREVFPETREQRCWVHKTANVLAALPKSLQAKAKSELQDIWMAPTRIEAEGAMARFDRSYMAKYSKAVNILRKDQSVLLSFFDFPAEHWVHLRTTNPIESSFATIRHRTRQTRNCVSRESLLGLMFKLGKEAEKSWRKIRGFKLLPKVIANTCFVDGVQVAANGAPELQQDAA
jgi:transposase-like protein